MAKTVTIKSDLKSFKAMSVIIKKEDWTFAEGMKFPIIQCPSCGSGILGDTCPHGIHSDGSVYASVVCQNDECNFHSYVKLENWNNGEIKQNYHRHESNY